MSEILESDQFSRLLDQARTTLHDQEDMLLVAETRAATVGFALGQQVRHLGDNPARRNLFDCLYELEEDTIILLALEQRKNPVEISEIYRSAMMGKLSDEAFLAYGVDQDAEVGSIIDAGWTGARLVEAQSRSVHKFKLGARMAI